MNPNRLLVVVDEAEVCQFVEAVARDQGFEVAPCFDGEEFKRLYGAFRPSAVIFDVVMPDLDGIELVRFLAEEGCRCPILAISGHPTYLGLIRGLGRGLGLDPPAGAPKPLRKEDLRRFLHAAAYRAAGVA